MILGYGHDLEVRNNERLEFDDADSVHRIHAWFYTLTHASFCYLDAMLILQRESIQEVLFHVGSSLRHHPSVPPCLPKPPHLYATVRVGVTRGCSFWGLHPYLMHLLMDG